MLVQKDNISNPIYPKSLNFSSWLSLNIFKIITIATLIATVSAVFFLRSAVDSTSFLCFQSKIPQLKPLNLPQISYDSITPITDNTTPYSRFRSDQWIVVSVSDYPSDSIKKLLKIKGWQVLAIGNSKTPNDWSLKGTIFLSLEEQAKLGFRVVDYLPYDSYVRKMLGICLLFNMVLFAGNQTAVEGGGVRSEVREMGWVVFGCVSGMCLSYSLCLC